MRPRVFVQIFIDRCRFGFGKGSPLDITAADEETHLWSMFIVVFEDENGWG
jgi:hypothetical protein